MADIEELRRYEAVILRPRWDYLSSSASAAAGVLNWDSAPAAAWDRAGAESYSDMVVKWAVQVQRALQDTDPEGLSNDPGLVSLRTNFEFHIRKMIHLQQLGISVPEVPSDLRAAWEGFKQGVREIPLTLGGWGKWILPALIVLGAVLFLTRRKG